MDTSRADDETFVPADSAIEASGRILALTGRDLPPTRGEKRALVALGEALDLDVPIVRTNAVLGEAISRALGIAWHPDIHTVRTKVTLAGLNHLLHGAAEARRRGRLRRLRDTAPIGLAGPIWDAFQPARSKIEAVTRIAALTGAPKEDLGPGGKERKSVLLNLADGLFPGVESLDRTSKTRLGRSLAARLGVPWTDRCESTGETISLEGLNVILAGAERHLGVLGMILTDVLRTAEDEGDALAAGLLARLPKHWEGRAACTWLLENGLRGGLDNEWQGFYGEERARIALGTDFTPPVSPPRARFGNTTFDYTLNRVWDIKVHTETQVLSTGPRRQVGALVLNDERAIRECVDQQGLGFLVISGVATMDEDGSFVTWQRALKQAHRGGRSARSNSGLSRMRKSAFSPVRVEAFWIPDSKALEVAVAEGAITPQPQGRQAPGAGSTEGAARAGKLRMMLDKARGTLRVSHHARVESRQPRGAATRAPTG